MSCVTCSNCGFVNSLSAKPQIQKLKCSDDFISQILRGSCPLLESNHAPINDDIAKLERLGCWYNAQLHAVRKSRKIRKSVYAPIRRLPRDVLLEIFHSVCDSWRCEVEAYKIKCDSLDTTGPLWVLSGVCGRWRNILHTSPVSWARCVIVQPPFSKHAPERLQKYLERTAEHPLSLAAICYSSNLAADAEILSFLVQSSHRWKNVCIGAREDHMHYLESVSHFPVLQTIDIQVFDDDGYIPGVSSDICLKAPRLWQATLQSTGIDQFMLPSGITHYSGRILCVEDLHLLSQLPKLRTCHLRLSEALNDIQVVMAELRELYVDYSDTLDWFTAPMLQSLTVVLQSFTITEAQGLPSSSGIAPFLRRSGCRLKSLSTCADMPLIKNILSLEACSTISYLKLELYKDWVPIPKYLSPSSDLPNLRRLLLCFAERYFHLETEQLALLDMIRSRCKTGQLKMIETSFEGDTCIPHNIQTDIRTVIGDNVEMRVGKWSPLDLDYRYSFSGPYFPVPEY
ncbi:hypothetical protein F5146DRAFT_185369 [Armillaria mellea]|nr:hypothetical protein F5146DRAFT_185369 [Armillaria mellea]